MCQLNKFSKKQVITNITLHYLSLEVMTIMQRRPAMSGSRKTEDCLGFNVPSLCDLQKKNIMQSDVLNIRSSRAMGMYLQPVN